MATERLKLSHPEQTDGDIGPLISKDHREKVLPDYTMAKAEGAKIRTIGGGVPDLGPKFVDGAWIEPTVWTELPEQAG